MKMLASQRHQGDQQSSPSITGIAQVGTETSTVLSSRSASPGGGGGGGGSKSQRVGRAFKLWPRRRSKSAGKHQHISNHDHDHDHDTDPQSQSQSQSQPADTSVEQQLMTARPPGTGEKSASADFPASSSSSSNNNNHPSPNRPPRRNVNPLRRTSSLKSMGTGTGTRPKLARKGMKSERQLSLRIENTIRTSSSSSGTAMKNPGTATPPPIRRPSMGTSRTGSARRLSVEAPMTPLSAVLQKPSVAITLPTADLSDHRTDLPDDDAIPRFSSETQSNSSGRGGGVGVGVGVGGSGDGGGSGGSGDGEAQKKKKKKKKTNKDGTPRKIKIRMTDPDQDDVVSTMTACTTTFAVSPKYTPDCPPLGPEGNGDAASSSSPRRHAPLWERLSAVEEIPLASVEKRVRWLDRVQRRDHWSWKDFNHKEWEDVWFSKKELINIQRKMGRKFQRKGNVPALLMALNDLSIGVSLLSITGDGSSAESQS